MTYPPYDRSPSWSPTPPHPLPPPTGYWQVTPWAPTPPKRSAAVRWLVGGLLALVVAGGTAAILLLPDRTSGVLADPPGHGVPAASNTPTSEPRSVPAPPSECLVECGDRTTPGGSATEAHYSGSDDTAESFVQDIASGDVAGAHAALCGAGKSEFPTPEELLSDFDATFGISEITGARLTGVHAADATADAVVFALQTDVGDITVEVYVVQEGSALAVCGYDYAG